MNDTEQTLPLIPVTPALPGVYGLTNEVGIEWRYVYDVHPSSKCGRLTIEGAELPEARPGDRLKTPWGIMYFSSTAGDRGWFLEPGRALPRDVPARPLLPLADPLLDRSGTWKAACGEWWYTVRAHAMGTRSERRAGELRYRRVLVSGGKEGDFADTPWGRLRWLGPLAPQDPTDYEQGFLLRGTYDRPLDQLAGDPIVPNGFVDLHFQSLYLANGVKLLGDAPAAHQIGLELAQRVNDSELSGMLRLDPNTCSLNAFGDREACTRIAVRSTEVTLMRQRLGDPKQHGRRFYAMRGPGVAADVALISSPDMHIMYLKMGADLVPLFREGEI